jgi:hypothetical protein
MQSFPFFFNFITPYQLRNLKAYVKPLPSHVTIAITKRKYQANMHSPQETGAQQTSDVTQMPITGSPIQPPSASRNVVVSWDLVQHLVQREMSLKVQVARLEQSVSRLGYTNQQERISYNQLAEEYDQLKLSYAKLVEQATLRMPAPVTPNNFEKILNYGEDMH